MDWGRYRAREAQRNTWDKRVQCIRCTSCHRLRAHPRQDDPRTWNCGCGGMSFVSSQPHNDEMQTAVKLYSRDIEVGGVYTRIAEEILNEGRAKHPLEGDMPLRARLYTK